MYTTLLTSLENNVLTITINRPEKLNALNKNVFTDLEKALNEIEKTALELLNASISATKVLSMGSKRSNRPGRAG